MKTKTQKRSIRRVHSRPKKTTRVTVDFPEKEHRKLKALASLAGMSLQEYIRSHIMEKVNVTKIPDAKFKKLMEQILEEDEDVLRRLADR